MRVFGIGVLALSMGVTSPVWAGEDPEPDQGGEQGDQGGDQGGGDQGGGDQGGDRQDDQQSEAGSSTTTFGYAKVKRAPNRSSAHSSRLLPSRL